MSKKTLYIIDGHAHIYAAYFAPMGGAMNTPSGEPTKAVYIFTNILIKLMREHNPDMVVVAMDSPGKSFRHEMYEDYKANRPPMPDDMPGQIARIDSIIEAMNIPVVRHEGYEADDIIGTLTKRGRESGFDVVICSKDKDLEQLIGDGVCMMDIQKGKKTDVESLYEDKGLKPDQIIDLLSLTGDTSDNVPGVPKVGPKTAVKWLQQYDSLDGIIEHQDEIKGKVGENLRDSLDTLELSRKLVTIDCEMDLDFDFTDAEVTGFDNDSLAKIFNELAFKKLLKQLELDGVEVEPDPAEANYYTPPKIDKPNYQLIDDMDKFDEFLKELKKQKVFAIDTETTGLNPVANELVGISISWQEGTGYYLPVKGPFMIPPLDWEEVRPLLAPILEDEKVGKVGQNIKYDTVVFRKAGVRLRGVIFDTMLASYVKYNNRSYHNMDSMAKDYLDHDTIKISELIGKGKNQITFDMVDLDMACDYAAEDADITWRLYRYLDSRLDEKELRELFESVEMPLVDVLAEMEFNGMALDVPCLKRLSNEIAERMDELSKEITSAAGCSFNIDSPKQLGDILFEKLGLPSQKKTKSGYSTDQDVLEKLSEMHPVPKMVLEYRHLGKLRSTYVDKLPIMICSSTGRVHGSFNQTGTATGRLSSSDPNLQNIPIRSELGRQIRKAFVPQSKGWVLLAADYSQVELRMLAHLSDDPGLKEAFASGQDIHSFVAGQVFDVDPEHVTSDQRSRAKAVNFGIVYGQSAYGLSQAIDIPVAEAARFIDDYFKRYPKIGSYMDSIKRDALESGYVSTILGRRRAIMDISGGNPNQRKAAERMAVNTVVQGSAADLMKLAMIDLHNTIKKESLEMKMILQVHDELVFEMPAEKAEEYGALISEKMTGAMKLSVPLVAEANYGTSWYECK